jgi:tRNA dimethylallyltransferase
MKHNLLTVLGPTATGKTRIASLLASELNGEIISADSRQVYIGMDIGTGKDLDEFKTRKVNYHLIDIVTPVEEYNLFRFTKDFHSAYNTITAKKKLPILVGGSGLYLSAVLQNYNLPEIKNSGGDALNKFSLDELKEILFSLKPSLHNTTDLIQKERIIQAILIEQANKEKEKEETLLNSLNIGINPGRDEIKKRITKRLKERLEKGMIEEVQNLLKLGVTDEKLQFFGLEYKYLGLFVKGDLSYNDMYQKLNSAIHNFAKRQMTWFRKMEKEGVKINWFSGKDYYEILDFIKTEFQKE